MVMMNVMTIFVLMIMVMSLRMIISRRNNAIH